MFTSSDMGQAAVAEHLQPPQDAVLVRITYDLDHRQWVATTLQGPTLTVRAPQYPQARRRIRRIVARANPPNVRIEERLELPPTLQTRLCRFQRRQSLWRSLAAFVREERMPLAHQLLELQMAQSDVAALLAISQAQLSSWLERDMASEVPSAAEAAE